MGVDGLDLVIQVEKRFGVTLTNEHFPKMRSVADVAAQVIALLPRAGEQVCPTAHTFYELRRQLVERLRCERRSVRPRTRLEDILPRPSSWRARRRIWSAITKHNKNAPALDIVPEWRRLADAAGLALLCVSPVVAFGVVWTNTNSVPVAIGTGVGTFLLAGVAYIVLTMPLRTALPPALTTVGDLAKLLAPVEIPATPAGRRLAVEQRVLDEVRAILADVTATPLEKVKAESDLVKDLGFG